MKRHLRFWTVVLLLLTVKLCYAVYDGTTASQLDATRPPDTGESRSYGAAAIREHKRAFLNWLAVEHYLSGAHESNFLAAYMVSTNSIPAGALQTNSVGLYALSSGALSNSMVYIASVDTTQTEVSDTNVLVSLFNTSSAPSVPSNGYRYLMIEADVSFRNELGDSRGFISNSFWRIEGAATNAARVFPDFYMARQHDENMQRFSFITTGTNTTTVTFDFRTQPTHENDDLGATLVNARVWGIW